MPDGPGGLDACGSGAREAASSSFSSPLIDPDRTLGCRGHMEPTELGSAGPYRDAEPEHWDYLESYPARYTCHFVRAGWKLPHRAQAKAS